MSAQAISVGLVGARGYVGQELITLIHQHPYFHLNWLSSRALAGQTIGEGDSALLAEDLSPQAVAARQTDLVILALPNGLAAAYVAAIELQQNCQAVLDLSADYRFDESWLYSIPELHSEKFRGVRHRQLIKISNPGCYATAMQLAIAPIKTSAVNRIHCFGVSGYSGAGTGASATNNAHNLQENIIAYKLIEHLHEKEASYHQDYPVSFSPHVADFFRGINMTLQIELGHAEEATALLEHYADFYGDSPLVKVQQAVPTLRQTVNTACCVIGGFQLTQDGRRASLVSCLDNLLKGAASQAMQNANLAFGFDAQLGLSGELSEFQFQSV